MKQLSRIEIIRKNVSIQRISMGGVLVACLVFNLAVNIKPANADKPDRAVHALFNLHHPETGPFPSDIFTVADHTHNTGRRVNLPYPDCTVRVSDCEDLDVVNTLDGFGLQTRLSIPFDGPIDANTATKETVFLISLGSTLRREHDHDGGDDIDNRARCHRHQSNRLGRADEHAARRVRRAARPTHSLRAHRHRSACGMQQGGRSRRATAFRRFRQTARGEYKQALLEAIHAARRLGVRERNIVTASVFTTQSITSVMERIRDQIKAGTPAPANFAARSDGRARGF